MADRAAADKEKDESSTPLSSIRQPGVTYGKYLHLDELLNCVHLESEKEGRAPAHDEHLFIIVHQTYELWFKQILFELESISKIFEKPPVDERNMLIVTHRLNRICDIQNILVSQVSIVETMDPSDFLAFRNYLSPASGFQSVQFRVLENRLGLAVENRTKYQQLHYKDYFNKQEGAVLTTSEDRPTLFALVESWLERTPTLNVDGFSFWKEYTASIAKMHEDQRKFTRERTDATDAEKAQMIESINKGEEAFQSVLDKDKYDLTVQEGHRRLSHAAFQGAIMINIYRHEPKFHLPYRMLTQLMEIDANMTKWRYRHVQMVQRMIGSKVGTGGSSGYHYLRTTVSDKYKVFNDLFNVPTYLLPREYVPTLPEKLVKSLHYSS